MAFSWACLGVHKQGKFVCFTIAAFLVYLEKKVIDFNIITIGRERYIKDTKTGKN